MFDSAKQKIERADYHISDLERQFAAFVAEKPHKFTVQSDPSTGQLVVMVYFHKRPPSTLATIIGDAIHNMRCALDHMTWEVVGIGGTQNRHLKLPAGSDRVSFEASCNGIETPDQWVKDAIRALEVFPGGKGSRLYEIHLLDNTDKHQAISPVLRATGIPVFSATYPDGQIVRPVKDQIVATHGAQEGVPLVILPPGSALELDDDTECPPSIFMRKASNGHLVPVFHLLKECSAAVNDAISSVESATPF